MSYCLIILIIISALIYIYIKLENKNKYWLKKGVKQGSPVPIFGDKSRALIHNETLAEMVQRIYKIGPEERYCGAYDFMSPALVLKDPELIKDILVKDFEHFVDHKRVIPEGSDPIWDKNLFFLTGQKWKDMRSTLSPVFTGSKIRNMFFAITKIAQAFVGNFSNDEEVVEVEVKETFARLTSDIIASTVFGFECNSVKDQDNSFYLMARKITDFSGFWQGLRLLGFFILPSLYKVFNIRILSTEVSSYFYKLVKDNIRSRQEQNINRIDMIQLLMKAREEHKLIHGVEITDEDVTAQALVFLFAGFDSVSSLMCMMAYELALNPDIQKRLIEEVDRTENIDYETVKSMKYLDMVISESLRKWPITPFVNRVCTIPYTLQPQRMNEKPIYFEKDSIAFIPIYGLHHDPKFFPDPQRFDPERFSDVNKSKIVPYSYLPFGAGPRKCIGYRFALLEVKLLFYFLLSKFELVPVERTQIPVKMCKKALNMTPEDGLWIGLKRRTC